MKRAREPPDQGYSADERRTSHRGLSSFWALSRMKETSLKQLNPAANEAAINKRKEMMTHQQVTSEMIARWTIFGLMAVRAVPYELSDRLVEDLLPALGDDPELLDDLRSWLKCRCSDTEANK